MRFLREATGAMMHMDVARASMTKGRGALGKGGTERICDSPLLESMATATTTPRPRAKWAAAQQLLSVLWGGIGGPPGLRTRSASNDPAEVCAEPRKNKIPPPTARHPL